MPTGFRKTRSELTSQCSNSMFQPSVLISYKLTDFCLRHTAQHQYPPSQHSNDIQSTWAQGSHWYFCGKKLIKYFQLVEHWHRTGNSHQQNNNTLSNASSDLPGLSQWPRKNELYQLRWSLFLQGRNKMCKKGHQRQSQTSKNFCIMISSLV